MTPLCSAKSKPESVSHAFLDEFELAYHRAVAECLCAEPEAVLQCARRNLDQWTEVDALGLGDERPYFPHLKSIFATQPLK